MLMAPALYGITARTASDELIRCDSVADLADLAPLVSAYAAEFAGRADVWIDLDATPAP
jgi:hypothetical protein